MHITTLFSAVVVSFVLLGCAAPAPSGGYGGHGGQVHAMAKAKKLDCRGGGKCQVTVAVLGCPSSCYISVDAELIVVLEKSKDDITWVLKADSAYSFPENGIVFDDPSYQFRCKQKEPKTFTCSNKHDLFGVYKYAITVVGPTVVPPLDPWVIND